MTKRKIREILVVGAVFVSSFVGSPVFAENPMISSMRNLAVTPIENPVDIDIVEVVDDGYGNLSPWQDITAAMPGQTYSIIPKVQNNGSVPVKVRMCVTETAINASGEIIVLPIKAFEVEANPSWSLVDSGASREADCYRYNSMLEPGEVSEPLFYEVKLSAMFENEHQGATFNLHLDADAMSKDDAPIPAAGTPDTGENAPAYFEIVSPVFCTAIVLAVLMGVAYFWRHFYRRKR